MIKPGGLICILQPQPSAWQHVWQATHLTADSIPKPSAEKTEAIQGKISNGKLTVSCHKQQPMNSIGGPEAPQAMCIYSLSLFSKHFTEVLYEYL